MRLVGLSDVHAGMRLGEPLFGTGGQLLLAHGVTLTPRYVTTLHEMRVPALYISDPDTADIDPPHPVPHEVRAGVMRTLTRAVDAIGREAERFRDMSAAEMRSHINSDRFAGAMHAVADGEGLGAVARDVDAVLDQLGDRDVLVGLNSIKTHDSYTYQHSIDVTIMGLLLARRARWDRSRLRSFGVGCLLHDIGKVFVRPHVLNKTGRLSGEEFERLKLHPALGYELIRAIAPSIGYLAPLVAHQHHERQDGSGYPRGLRGSNALGDAPAAGTIHDFGAVAAVADVYDAMSSDRPYRAAWAPARVANTIRGMAGAHLNRQAVQLFTATVAPFPVCSSVRVLTGALAGQVGIVASVPPDALDRPRVRVLYDASGARRREPVEIDLSVELDVELEPVQCLEPIRHSQGAPPSVPPPPEHGPLPAEVLDTFRQLVGR